MQTYGELLSLDGVWSSSVTINKAACKQGKKTPPCSSCSGSTNLKTQSFWHLGPGSSNIQEFQINNVCVLMLKETKANTIPFVFN